MNMSGLAPLRNGCRILLSAFFLRAQDSWPFFFKKVSSHVATHVIPSILAALWKLINYALVITPGLQPPKVPFVCIQRKREGRLS